MRTVRNWNGAVAAAGAFVPAAWIFVCAMAGTEAADIGGRRSLGHDPAEDLVLLDHRIHDLMPRQMRPELTIRNGAHRELVHRRLPNPEHQQHDEKRPKFDPSSASCLLSRGQFWAGAFSYFLSCLLSDALAIYKDSGGSDSEQKATNVRQVSDPPGLNGCHSADAE